MIPNCSQIVYDEALIIQEIKRFPQTYETLLQEPFSRNTQKTILVRKLNNLCDCGEVKRCVLPNTRRGKVMFYMEPKDYHVLVIAERFGSGVFTFKNYKRVGEKKYYIKAEQCWKLNGHKWDDVGKQMFFEGDILKVI